MMNYTNEVLTPVQTAVYLQVSEASVRAMLRRGVLPGRKLGRLWRLRKADIEAYLSATAPEDLSRAGQSGL